MTTWRRLCVSLRLTTTIGLPCSGQRSMIGCARDAIWTTGESSAWAGHAAPVVDALSSEVAARPSAELVVLLQRAAEHLVKVILHADDSNGMIGSLAGDILEQHRLACQSGGAEPRALAKWMVRFTFEDQDFFTIDPVAYVDALGDTGLAVYRDKGREALGSGQRARRQVGGGPRLVRRVPELRHAIRRGTARGHRSRRRPARRAARRRPFRARTSSLVSRKR